jgi:hypothetical protein
MLSRVSLATLFFIAGLLIASVNVSGRAKLPVRQTRGPVNFLMWPVANVGAAGATHAMVARKILLPDQFPGAQANYSTLHLRAKLVSTAARIATVS